MRTYLDPLLEVLERRFLAGTAGPTSDSWSLLAAEAGETMPKSSSSAKVKELVNAEVHKWLM